MATSFGARDIRYPDSQEKEPEVVQEMVEEKVEEIESGPEEVPVLAPINPCGHK